MSEDFKKKYNNHEVEITGWLFGSYKSYMYTIPAEVEDLGEYEEVVPEGAIYYSTFDKELASQTYGTGSSWPYLDQFDGWINHKGSGANDVTYDFKSMSVRANQSSKGDLSLYDGSGKNNIFFSTAPNHFTIEKIAVTDRNLQLSFGAQRYAHSQVWCMGLDKVSEKCNGRITNWGEICRQHILPEGSVEDVIDAVHKMKEALWVNGGLIGQFEAGPDMPLENIKAGLIHWND